MHVHEEGYQKRQFSDEARRKMSESAKGKKHGPLSQSQRDAVILSNRTRTVTDETREKIRLKAVGRHLSEEARRKIGIANAGRKKSPEELHKLSVANKGKKLSEETRQKLSAAGKKRMQDPERRKKAFGLDKISKEELSRRVKAARRHGWTEQAERFCDDRDYAIEVLDSFDDKPTYRDLFEKLGCCTQQICKAISAFGLKDRVKMLKGSSNAEKDIADFIESLGVDVIRDDRSVLDGLELDVYVPDKHLAVEYDGMYWHNEDFKDKSYHLGKSLLCKHNSIRLIHIFEWEWLFKQDIIKSMIKSALGLSEQVYARKCTVAQIDSKTSSAFLDKNHIQGNVNAPMRIGLLHEDELVAVMTFGKPRFKNYDGVEMLRYAVKQNMSVTGGMSKLLKHAVSIWHFKKVLSYCNLSKFDGRSYETIGFTMTRQTSPSYWWCNLSEFDILSRYQTQMKDEVNVMRSKGYRRVWDCGTRVYELEVD